MIELKELNSFYSKIAFSVLASIYLSVIGFENMGRRFFISFIFLIITFFTHGVLELVTKKVFHKKDYFITLIYLTAINLIILPMEDSYVLLYIEALFIILAIMGKLLQLTINGLFKRKMSINIVAHINTTLSLYLASILTDRVFNLVTKIYFDYAEMLLVLAIWYLMETMLHKKDPLQCA